MVNTKFKDNGTSGSEDVLKGLAIYGHSGILVVTKTIFINSCPSSPSHGGST